jgi:thioredoxin reductase (NADPH)
VLAVIGGGDTAVEEASHLAKFGSKVIVIHRRDKLRASRIMQKRLLENPKIEVIWDSAVEEALGERVLHQVRVRSLETNEERLVAAGGLFYAIGHEPNTSFLERQVLLDETGYIVTRPGTTQTSVNGVFAAGDVRDKHWRQAITAAGTGSMAALEAERFLVENVDPSSA